MAVTATPALAMRNDDLCLLAYGHANYWQDAMESAQTNEEYWGHFRMWAAEMNMISKYC